MAVKRVRLQSDDDKDGIYYGNGYGPGTDPNRYSDAPFDRRVRNPSPGIAGLWEGLGGMYSDAERGFANGLGSIWDFLSSQPAGTSRWGQDWGYGPDLPQSGMPAGVGKAIGKSRIPKGQQQEAPPQLTFADYLRMANEMGLGGGGTDFGALEAQLRQNAANADAKLAAMYNQLRGSIDADAAVIGQTYDAGAAGLTQNADQALGTINNAYQAARDAQTQQFQQLGIGDAAGVLAAQGGNAAADQANAIGNVAQNSGANQQQLGQNRVAALNYNTGIGNAAGLEGAVQRAAVQQELANRLAELQTQQSQEGSQRQQNLFQAALGMAQNPGIFDPNYQGNPMDALKAQLLAAQITAQDLKNQGLAANSSGQIGGNLSQYQTLAQAYGIDPSDQEAFLNFIKLVNETQ